MAWQLEAVEWEDVTSISRFTLDHDFESERLFKLSVGFVIQEAPEYIVLADDVDTSRRQDSPNNYGTIIPKGCIRSRQVIHSGPVAEPGQGRKAATGAPAASSNGQLLRRFLQLNPHVVVSARDLGLRLGVEQPEAQRQLAELERTGEARQALPGLWHAARLTSRRGG